MATPADLDPGMDAIDGVLIVLGTLADEIGAAWAATATGDDPEDLHALRVAIRRTRVVLDNARSVLPPRFVDDSRQSLGGLAKVTAINRDLDAFAGNWEAYVGRLDKQVATTLISVPTLIAARRDSARATTVATIAQPRLLRIIEGWPAELGRVPNRKSQGRNATRPLHWLVRRKLQSVQERVLERGRLIDADSTASKLHQLRIDTKSLRYLVECYASLLPKGPRKEFLEPLKVLQAGLGSHQDAVAHHTLVGELTAELTQSGSAAELTNALTLLADQLYAVQTESRRQFAKAFDNYDRGRTRTAFKEMQRRLR